MKTLQTCGYFPLLVILLTIVKLIVGLPNGAPIKACNSMEPNHGSPAQNSPSPFIISTDQEYIYSNESLTVTLNSTNPGDTFRGYLILAFDSSQPNSSLLGTFQSTNQSRTIECTIGSQNAVTHSDDSDKDTVTVKWNPPLDFNGSVIFKTTFVQRLDKFWVKEESQIIHVIQSDNNVSSTPPTITGSTVLSTVIPEDPTIYDECGKSKGCFGTPEGCFDKKSCSMMTTFRSDSDDSFSIEVYGECTSNCYVAVGFSEDAKMEGDSVIECTQYSGQVNGYMSFNYNEYNLRLPNSSDGLNVIETGNYNGYVYCKVEKSSNYVVEKMNFTLHTKPYFLLMASGPADSGNVLQHSVAVASHERIDLNSHAIYGANESRILIQLHGSFMVIAWLLAASTGVMFPRYLRQTWVGKKFMKKDLWFVFHQGMMITAWILTIIAFILIFVHVEGWVSEPLSENVHPLLGCITTGLAFIQPIMAAFRPEPSAPKRYIFNWAHSIVGYSAHILAITCIFLSVTMKDAQLPFITYWILTTHISVYVTTHIIFLVLQRRRTKSNDDSSKDAKGSSLRKIILAIYCCLITGCAITVIAFISGAVQD